jgi:rhodanese-related sulfurtransferase
MMKKLFVKSTLVVGISILSLCNALGDQPSSDAPKNALQDTQKAAQYFEDEMNFKTNISFIKRALKEKIENVIIVDVRSANDFAKGHIPGAINIPFDQYNKFEGPETAFPGLRKDAFNCIYCYTLTCSLSQKAAKKFASLGYPVKEIIGGYDAWVDHKYPVETGVSK